MQQIIFTGELFPEFNKNISMDQVQSQLIKKYLDLFWRRKIFITILFLLSLPLGLGFYLRIPKTYQATCLLSYQQQQINPNKMSPEMRGRITETVSTLTQIVTSRSNLETMIKDLNLYPEMRQEKPIEDVIDVMREKIVIIPSKRGDTFRISFEGGDRQKVVRTTNALAAKFIEENLQYRQDKATETSSYTSDELRMAKAVMDKQEMAMRDYKLKHYNEMPDQHQSNVSRLISLQEQYQGKQESIQDLERTLVMIQDQIGARKIMLDAERNRIMLAEDSRQREQGENPAETLGRLYEELETMQRRYSDKHPRVKLTRKKIAKLEKELGGVPKTSKKRNRSAYKTSDQVLLQLQSQKRNVELSIEAIKDEKKLLKEEIAKYDKWVAATPIREAEWAVLTREYSQLKKHYEYLVAQDLEAKSMLNLERRQKGSQFKIEDPARTPSKPIKPDFMIIMLGAVACGLGLSFGSSFVLDLVDSSFRNAVDIESFLDVPVLGTIPYIETDQEKKKAKIWFIVKIFLLGFLSFAILGLFLYVWSKGMIVM